MNSLFAVVVPHSENLYHANEDVNEVKLEANTLVHNVALDVAALGQTSVVQDLLNIIESEATEHGQTTVEPDTLRPHQSASGGGGENHGGKTGKGNKNDTSKERSTEVQVLLLLGGSTNESNGAHQTDSIETSASEDSRVVEHERRQKSGLSQVEKSPATIFHNIANMNVSQMMSRTHKGNKKRKRWYSLIRRGVESSVHRANAADQTDTHDEPRVHRHKAIGPAARVKRTSGNTNDTNTKTSVHESLIQEASLVGRHAAILASLTVEDKVGSQNGTTNDGGTIDQLLSEVSRLRIVGRLHVVSAESILKGLTGFGEDRGLGSERLGYLCRLKRRVVDESSCVGKLRNLMQSRRYGERAPKEECHDDDEVGLAAERGE